MYFYTHRSTLQPMVSLAAHDTERLHIYTFRRPADTKQMQNFAVNSLAEVNLHFLSARTVASYDNLTWHNFASFLLFGFYFYHSKLSTLPCRRRRSAKSPHSTVFAPRAVLRFLLLG